jgi:hypothetical protein
MLRSVSVSVSNASQRGRAVRDNLRCGVHWPGDPALTYARPASSLVYLKQLNTNGPGEGSKDKGF